MQFVSFEGYNLAVLDASFYCQPIPTQVLEELKKVKVVISNTFDFELEQYSKILPQESKEVYESNIQLINDVINQYNISFNKLSPKIFCDLNDDVWGLVNYLEKCNYKYIIITGNELLIQRIILHKINSDIFNINSNQLITFEDFDEYEKLFEFKNFQWSIQPESYDSLGTDDVVYTESGKPILLGKEVNSGSEAVLYRLKNDSSHIAKIFRKNSFSPNKYKNTKKILDIKILNELNWALFPTDILYFDQNRSIPVGIVEKFAPKSTGLDKNTLYIGELSELSEEDKKTRVSDSIDICIKLTRQIILLNSLGFIISDFNMGNFALNPNNADNIQMWDTDSFGFSQYFSGYCSGDPTTREYDISKKIEAIDFCNESLYLFVFIVMSLGDTPISQFSPGMFKYNNENYAAIYRKKFFPSKLWGLFDDVFNNKRYPSVEILLRTLIESKRELIKNEQNNLSYGELLKKIEEQIDPPSPPKPRIFQKIIKVVAILLFISLIVLSCCAFGYFWGYYSSSADESVAKVFFDFIENFLKGSL